MKKTYLQLMREHKANPTKASAKELDLRQKKHLADMNLNEPAIEKIKNRKK